MDGWDGVLDKQKDKQCNVIECVEVEDELNYFFEKGEIDL
jgi:hypothetical protein